MVASRTGNRQTVDYLIVLVDYFVVLPLSLFFLPFSQLFESVVSRFKRTAHRSFPAFSAPPFTQL